ncbi:MAG: hypothetical protein KDK70_25615 [Myxococcales bacterium]|nr:hypothetical protein [Myxococcales bacterium]
MSTPPPIPVVRTPSLVVLARKVDRRSYFIFCAEGAREDVWLRRDLVLRTEPTPAGLWVEGLLQAHGRPNFLRVPCRPADAQSAHERLAALLGPPPSFEPVEYDELARHPEVYGGRWIDCRGTWTFGFEHSSFAGAWVTAPADAALPRQGTYELRMRGLFEHSPTFPGFGHLGVSRSGLEVFDTAPRLPGVQRSGLEPEAPSA